MSLYLIDDRAIFGRPLLFPSLPALLSEFLLRYPKTPDLELEGSALVRADFPASSISSFVKSVSYWGGYAGVGGRVLRNNDPERIAEVFREATRLLGAPSPDFEGALATINGLKDLGTPSFASKHLRFLRPDVCPVFDSILRDVLPYSFDPQGYQKFAVACGQIAQESTKRGIPHPLELRSGRWFSADVEAALFCEVQGWTAT